MSEHTPVPWGFTEDIPEDMRVFVTGYSSGEVCEMVEHPGLAGQRETQKANARFIIRACNSFKDMFDTLSAIASGRYVEGEEQEMARAAIAKTEGEGSDE